MIERISALVIVVSGCLGIEGELPGVEGSARIYSVGFQAATK